MSKQVVVKDGSLKAALQAVGYVVTKPRKAQWPRVSKKHKAVHVTTGEVVERW